MQCIFNSSSSTAQVPSNCCFHSHVPLWSSCPHIPPNLCFTALPVSSGKQWFTQIDTFSIRPKKSVLCLLSFLVVEIKWHLQAPYMGIQKPTSSCIFCIFPLRFSGGTLKGCFFSFLSLSHPRGLQELPICIHHWGSSICTPGLEASLKILLLQLNKLLIMYSKVLTPFSYCPLLT